MKDANWEDLHLFYHVAKAGGLNSAVEESGVSAPTLGRRMLALEQQTGLSLFIRSHSGYVLSPEGRTLFQKVRAMKAASLPVQDMLSHQADTPLIRISAGTATASFLVDKFNLLSRPTDGFRLNFVTTEAVLDIAHREIDIGIRNRPPEAGNLASRKLAVLRFAPYRSWNAANPELLEWIAVDATSARHPAALWLHRQGLPIRAAAGSVATVHALVKAGAGIGIMPCMYADCDPTLARAGPIIEELTETQYLVTHADDRSRSPIRKLCERIVAIYRDNAELLAGAKPLRPE